MESKKSVAFDFDRTLTLHDTTLDFFQYCGRRGRFFIFKYYTFVFLWGIQKMGIISNLRLKNIGIHLFISPHKIDEVNQFALEFSKELVLNEVYYQYFLESVRVSNVYLVSAAFELYLRHLFPSVYILGTKLKERNGRYTEVEVHMQGEVKKRKLNEMGVLKLDEVYTDSISDLPLAKMSEKVFLVSNKEVLKCSSLANFYTNCKKINSKNKRDYLSVICCNYQNLK